MAVLTNAKANPSNVGLIAPRWSSSKLRPQRVALLHPTQRVALSKKRICYPNIRCSVSPSTVAPLAMVVVVVASQRLWKKAAPIYSRCIPEVKKAVKEKRWELMTKTFKTIVDCQPDADVKRILRIAFGVFECSLIIGKAVALKIDGKEPAADKTTDGGGQNDDSAGKADNNPTEDVQETAIVKK